MVEFNRRVRIGQGRRSRGRRRRDGCFICGAYDHWMRDCPQNTGYQQRAIGNDCLCLISQLWCVENEINPYEHKHNNKWKCVYYKRSQVSVHLSEVSLSNLEDCYSLFFTHWCRLFIGNIIGCPGKMIGIFRHVTQYPGSRDVCPVIYAMV